MSLTQSTKSAKQKKNNKNSTGKSLCYNCGKARYYAKDCYQKKKQYDSSLWIVAAMKKTNEPTTSSFMN